MARDWKVVNLASKATQVGSPSYECFAVFGVAKHPTYYKDFEVSI